MRIEQQVLTLAQWLSPAYPVGAFAYSHGLESAIQGGRIGDADDLREWLRDVLTHGSGRNDCVLVRAACDAPDQPALSALNDEALAFAATSERQLELRLQGAAFCKTTAAIWGGSDQAYVYPVAVGAAASHMKFDVTLSAAMYLHGVTGNLVSAAQRLMRLGQTEAQGIVADLTSLCDDIAQKSEGETLDDLHSTAFLSDIAAMHHETLQPRIFRS